MTDTVGDNDRGSGRTKESLRKLEEATFEMMGEDGAEMARKQRLMRWDKSKRKYVRRAVGELECLMVMVWLELTTTIPKNEEMLLKVVAGVVLAVRGLPLDLKRVVRVVREEMEEERTVLMMLIQPVSDPSRRLEGLGR